MHIINKKIFPIHFLWKIPIQNVIITTCCKYSDKLSFNVMIFDCCTFLIGNNHLSIQSFFLLYWWYHSIHPLFHFFQYYSYLIKKPFFVLIYCNIPSIPSDGIDGIRSLGLILHNKFWIISPPTYIFKILCSLKGFTNISNSNGSKFSHHWISQKHSIKMVIFDHF